MFLPGEWICLVMHNQAFIIVALRAVPLSMLLVLSAASGCQSLELPAATLADSLNAPVTAPPTVDAFTSTNATERREALAWWSQAPANASRAPLPDTALPLQRDPDPRVRAEFAAAVIRSGHNDAVPMVLSMLDDQEIQVRLAAIAALGTLRSDHPQRQRACDALLARLQEQSGHGEKIRAAAAGSLAQLGRWDDVRPCLDDPSWRVRLAVAQQLSTAPSDALPTDIAARLVHDQHPAVQRQVIDAVAAWPAAESVPLWLTALESEAYQSRVAAHGHLAKLWPAASEFPFDARSAAERDTALAALKARWEHEGAAVIAAQQAQAQVARAPAQLGAARPPATQWTSTTAGSTPPASPANTATGTATSGDQSPATASPVATDKQDHMTTAPPESGASAVVPASYQQAVVPAVSPETLSKLRLLLRTMQNRTPDQRQQQDWAQQLGNLGDDLLPALEALHRDRVPIPEFIYEEVLPQHSVVFRSLADLSSPAVDVRRRAAVALRAASQAQPLSPLAIDRLATLAEAEKDALVWQALVDAAGISGSGVGAAQASDRFWQLALEHPQSEVRRRACEYVGRLQRAKLASSLAKLADDRDSHVARAAARALGQLGPQADTAALEKMLASRDRSVRVEAAAALCKAGMHAGEAAISRLSYDPDPQIRMQVAEAIGELADEQFIPILIRFLDDARSVQRAALLALPKVTGRDMAAANTGTDGTPPTIAQQVAAWKTWDSERRLNVASDEPATPAETAKAPEKTQLRIVQ